MRGPRGQTAFGDSRMLDPRCPQSRQTRTDKCSGSTGKPRRWTPWPDWREALPRFNNFLMAIMGYTEMLESRTSATGEPCQEIEDMRDLCRDATTADAATAHLRQAPGPELLVLDVNQLVTDLDGRLRQVVGRKGHRVDGHPRAGGGAGPRGSGGGSSRSS